VYLVQHQGTEQEDARDEKRHAIKASDRRQEGDKMRKGLRWKFFRWVCNDVFKCPGHVVLPVWGRVLHSVLFPVLTLAWTNAYMNYRPDLDQFTIYGEKFSGLALMSMVDAADRGSWIKFYRTDGIMTCHKVDGKVAENAAEMYDELHRIYFVELPRMDEACRLAGLHPFDLTRKSLSALLDKVNGAPPSS
jgi:hypothetical protein